MNDDRKVCATTHGEVCGRNGCGCVGKDGMGAGAKEQWDGWEKYLQWGGGGSAGVVSELDVSVRMSETVRMSQVTVP